MVKWPAIKRIAWTKRLPRKNKCHQIVTSKIYRENKINFCKEILCIEDLQATSTEDTESKEFLIRDLLQYLRNIKEKRATNIVNGEDLLYYIDLRHWLFFYVS